MLVLTQPGLAMYIYIVLHNSYFIGNWYINGLMQERRNSIANALELCLFFALTYQYALWILVFSMYNPGRDKKIVLRPSVSFMFTSLNQLECWVLIYKSDFLYKNKSH